MPRRKNSSDEENRSPKRRRYNLRRTPYRVRLRERLAEDLEGRKNVISDEEFLEKNKVLKVSKKPGKALNLQKVLLPKENRYAHNTRDYDHSDVILRRGQSFTLVVIFDRDVSKEHDEITLQFAYGERPIESKGTVIRLKSDLNDSEKIVTSLSNWTLVVKEVEGPKVHCQVTTSPECSIGYYRLFTDTKIIGSEREDGRVITEYTDRRFIFLFNPWCPDDVVYMNGEDNREEYVMNETGFVYQGQAWWPHGKSWNFGQFEKPVLDVTLSLLEDGGLNHTAMSSPVLITRKLSAMANSNDDNGILVGRWTKEYPDNCTKPWEWNGSVAIIQQFEESKSPVQYGQCWVFSALLTTLCRALGIPTRSVTNFSSAHDTDMSMTIDKHYDHEGEVIEDHSDSVWNFHVWNESWFERRDLPSGYDGWQAFDATPQEASEDVMQCGPAPLKAIKEGHVYLNYDIGFIFAEVNGDKVIWQHDKNGDMSITEIVKKSVGKAISTKAVGKDEREDVTWLYKYPEGSEAEREVVEFVNRFSKNKMKRNIYDQDKTQAFSLEIKTPDETLIGDDFEVEVVVKNKSNSMASTLLRITLYDAYYTGLTSKRVLTQSHHLELNKNEAKTLKVEVPSTTYIPDMYPDGGFAIDVSAKNKETGGLQSNSEVFNLKKPNVEIEVPGDVFANDESEVFIRFANTTRLTLTNVVITVDGSKLSVDRKSICIKEKIKPMKEVKETIIIKPEKIRRCRANRKIIVSLTSDQVSGIEGEKYIHVQKRRTPDHPDSSDSDDE